MLITMKTLYERLSKEHKELIDNEAIKYPTTWNEIIIELKGFWWHELTLQHSMTIYAILAGFKAFDVSTFCGFFETKTKK